MEYEEEPQKKKRPGRKEFKEDVAEAIQKARKKLKKNVRPKKKAKKYKYDDMSAKEMFELVKQKRDMIL